jgi:hypothetical protein
VLYGRELVGTESTPRYKMSDIFLFSFALVDTGALIFILVFFIITLSGKLG